MDKLDCDIYAAEGIIVMFMFKTLNTSCLSNKAWKISAVPDQSASEEAD